MQVYLIRHAHAVDAAEDSRRPLSARGRKQARTVGRFLGRQADFAPAAFWQSPLARSQETVALLRTGLESRAPVVTVAALETGAGVRILAAKLRQSRRSLALVGHEPWLSALASLLVAGAEKPAVFELKKGAVLALGRTGRHWIVRWQVNPDLLKR